MAQALLSVEGLCIDLAIGARRFAVVKDVSFTIENGEMFGLVGESGCGKSVVALSLIGLLSPPLSVATGRIQFEGGEIQNLPSTFTPALFSMLISSINTCGSITTPPPIRPVVFFAKMPEGTRWILKVPNSLITV